MPKKKPIKGKPQVNPEIDGFELNINEFGQISSNFRVEKLNEFLNRVVEDKKLGERDDYDEIRKHGKPKDGRS